MPFTSFEWNAVWWRHLARHRFGVSDRLNVHTVRSDTGRLLGVAPLMLTSMPARGPLRARCLQFFGADPNITELRGLLCRPEDEHEVYRELSAYLFERSDEWDFLVWDGLRADSGVSDVLGRQAKLDVLREIPISLLQLKPTWEEFKSTRSRNIKESLRKCANSLKRANLVPTSRVISSGPELTAAIDGFIRLHGARAERVDTVKHPDIFGNVNAEQFLRDVCTSISRHDTVRVFTLELENKVVAVRIGFIVGKTLYLYYSGYDPEYAKYSVMTTVVADAIKYAISQGLDTVNLSTGRDVSKARWSPTEVMYHQVMQISTAAWAPLVTSMYMSLRRSARMASTYAHELRTRSSAPPPAAAPQKLED
jgi:CelD/BcsL family acetyltransferase involved in cellulose biosynthesis